MALMTDEDLMPFGKYKGQKMCNVPASYLVWLWDNSDNIQLGLKGYIKENLDDLKKEAAK